MSFPTYIVSYAAMNSEVGANPMGHACLLLSIWRNPHQKIEVVDAIGFYGVTPSSDTNPLIKYLKRTLSMDIDFSGGHGILQREELRYLDKGRGLKGVNFLVSQSQFQRLVDFCHTSIEQQSIAIDSAKIRLETKGKKAWPCDVRREEERRAELLQQPSRLQRFELLLKPQLSSGFTLKDSHTCKNVALSLLERTGVNQQQLQRLGRGSSRESLPRFSGDTYELQLHSHGQMNIHYSKRTGKGYFNRVWSPNFYANNHLSTPLFWSVPPQGLTAANNKSGDAKATRKLFDLPMLQLHSISPLLKNIEKISALVLHSEKANTDVRSKVELLRKLSSLSESFSYPLRNIDSSFLRLRISETEDCLLSLCRALMSDGLLTLQSVISHKAEDLLVILGPQEKLEISKLMGTSFDKNHGPSI